MQILSRQDLGTLKSDNSGGSEVFALSADGSIAAGWAHDDSGIYRATLWSGSAHASKTDLGTLRSDNSGRSEVRALSADGSIAVGWAEDDSGNPFRATLWSGSAHASKTNLGTLRSDNSGSSAVRALSADGSIAAGWASDDSGADRATLWSGSNYASKTNLGTLRNDNSGNSVVYALSADGSIAAGQASDDSGNPFRATLWSGSNYASKTDLGTLRSDNRGSSAVSALSADGSIAAGWANDDSGNGRATLWSGSNYASKTDLGTLKSDNSGWSRVLALSADGSIAAGWTNDDSGNGRATLWSGSNYASKTDLGTLKSDNSGHSEVSALSADGSIAAGWADDDSGNQRATLWRVAYPAKIDVANTMQTVANLGADSFSLMAMQAHALDRLQYVCRTEKGWCMGLQQDTRFAKDNHNDRLRDVALGANAAYAFGNGWSAGLALDHSLNRRLPDSFAHNGDGLGVGAVLRYDDASGYFGEFSAAYDSYSAEITRPVLANTELGANDANIRGSAYALKLGKAFADEQNQYRLYAGAKHQRLSRGAYTENEHTAFPISYGKMAYTDTRALLGAEAAVALNDKLAWVSAAQIERHLSGDAPVYTASLTGVEKHDFSYSAHPAKTQGQLSTGLRYQMLPNAHVEFSPYVQRSANGENGTGAVLRFESRF